MTPRRALSVLLRTAHLAAFAGLLGGHLWDVDPARLVPWLVATIASGAGLVAIELLSGLGWLGTGKGLAVLVKLVLLGAVPVFWERRVALLLAVTVLAGVASHLPRQVRHYQLIRIRGAGGSRRDTALEGGDHDGTGDRQAPAHEP